MREIFTMFHLLNAIIFYFITSEIYFYSQEQNKNIFFEDLSSVQVYLPKKTKPTPDQETLEFAIKYFHIHVPDHLQNISFDKYLDDRGKTVLSHTKISVFIGPKAFQSWSVLGSTLAHEIEIHGQQNFAWIDLLDKLQLDGTRLAEEEAYNYEMNNQLRFHLTRSEIYAIEFTKKLYYSF